MEKEAENIDTDKLKKPLNLIWIYMENKFFKSLILITPIIVIVGFAIVYFDNTKKQEKIDQLERTTKDFGEIINRTHLDTLITKIDSVKIPAPVECYFITNKKEPLNLPEINDKIDRLMEAMGYEYIEEVKYNTSHYERSKLEKKKPKN